MDEIEELLINFTQPDKPLRKNSYGLLLYGPPGTGKTQLCNVIIKKAGLFDLGIQPLSSSELNRSKVGETEQLLMSIFHRALHVPYLLSCIAIDEIDALVPKRNEKSGEHKVDVLCLLLSLIGGIKHVSNIFMIASTNRLNKIDEAFARRLQDKLYVGRLNAEQRLKIIKKIDDSKVQIEERFRNFFGKEHRVSLFNILTTNFSGAAIVSLRSQLLKFFDLNSTKEILSENEKDNILVKICAKVANDFQIKIGGYSIPNLIKDFNIGKLTQQYKKFFSSQEMYSLSGRVLIDLREEYSSIQFELIDGKLKEISLDNQKIKFACDLVSILLVLALIFKVPYFQLIDSNFILSNSAYEQSTAIEFILEKLNEYEQYKNSMIVFDADTLVGISESMSDSFMSESLSYSIQNSSIWQQIILHSFKSQFAKSNQNNKEDQHKWCIFISSSEFLINQFKKLAKFELSKKEFDFSEKERKCVNCDLTFYQKDNKRNSCSFHPIKLLQRIYKKSDNKEHIFEMTKDQLVAMARNSMSTDIFNQYYYICCMKRLNESDGCKNDCHKDIKLL
ncbi:cell division control 48 [Brachionus plicatilis]|uniref:Cell division control 48 n=1 Tax=Brachionus plicatilis TaxID=10195 RepID=A0A3M7PCI3_BRAPC|nr:cell division control 48 [Brachionus plicatilis]